MQRVPAHVRRGLLRLYFVVAVQLVAWFGYQLIDASHHYDRRQHANEVFRSLLVVSVGGPILYFVIPWVIAGSRRPTRGTNEAPKKNISTAKVRTSSGAKAAPPTTVTDFCRRIKKHHLQSEVEGIENNDPLTRGKALFKLVAMASVGLWTDMLEFENLHTSFATTNSDVVMVEALYWVWYLIANLMFADFNAAVAIAETDERGIKVPRSEMYNLMCSGQHLSLQTLRSKQRPAGALKLSQPLNWKYTAAFTTPKGLSTPLHKGGFHQLGNNQ
jgi:hypothetical protein